MASHGDGEPPSPEALRQLRAAIDHVAMRTGAKISSGDTALIATIMGGLSAGEREQLAHSPDIVLGKLSAIVTQYADLAARQQQAGAGPRGTATERDAAQGLHVQPRKGPAGSFWDQLAGRTSNEATSGSSERFAAAGMSAGPNGTSAEIKGVTGANYLTSPLTKAIAHTGMSYSTFDHLREQGFNRSHIAHAANDAKALGLNADDKRVAKNHATIRKHGDNPDETMRRMKAFQGDLRKSDEFRKAVVDYDAAKTDADKAKALQRVNEIADKIAGKQGGVTEDQKRQRSQAVQEAIGEIRKDVVKQEVKGAIDAKPVAGLQSGADQATPLKGDQSKAIMESLRKGASVQAPVASSGSPAQTPVAPVAAPQGGQPQPKAAAPAPK